MAVQCIFFLPRRLPACQVLQVARAPLLPAKTRGRLERAFCRTGAFINCPVFVRVEQGLSRFCHRVDATPTRHVRPGATLPQAAHPGVGTVRQTATSRIT